MEDISAKNAPFKEKCDIKCSFCKATCANKFLIPLEVKNKWGLMGDYHWECGIQQLIENTITQRIFMSERFGKKD